MIYIYIYIRTRIYIHISSCVYRHVGNQLFQHHFMKLSFESLYIHDLSIKHVGNTGMLTFTCDGFCAGKPNPSIGWNVRIGFATVLATVRTIISSLPILDFDPQFVRTFWYFNSFLRKAGHFSS